MPNLINQASVPVAQTRRGVSLSLDGVFRNLQIHTIRNEVKSDIPCRMANTPGPYEQESSGLAISAACDVMLRGRDALSASDRSAVDKVVSLLVAGGADRIRGANQCYLTVLGAMSAAMSLQMEGAADKDVLRECLGKVDKAIVDIAVRSGKCKDAADGAYHGDSRSKALCAEIKKAQGVIEECFRAVGGVTMLRGVAEAILPSAMKSSIAARLPHLLNNYTNANEAPDIQKVLQSGEMIGLQQVLGTLLREGSGVALSEAVLQVLKVPEYVKQGQAGQKAENGAPADQVGPPADLLSKAKDAAGGAPIAINHAPVAVNADFRELFGLLGKLLAQQQQPQPPASRSELNLTDVHNFMSDIDAKGYERGWLAATAFFQKQQIDELKQEVSELRQSKENTDLFAKGAGQIYVPLAEKDQINQGTNTEKLKPDQRVDSQLHRGSNGIVPPQEDLGQVPDTDKAEARLLTQSGGTDRIERSSSKQRDQVENPPDRVIPLGDRPDRKLDQDNGDGLVRRQPGGEDQTDRSNRPPSQNLLQNGSSGTVPPGDDLGDVPPFDNAWNRANLQSDGTERTDSSYRRDHQQQLGDGQLLLDPKAARLNRGGAAPFDDNAVVGEFERYLQALGREQTPRRRDPLQPFGPRNMVSNGDAEPSIKASDFPEYRDARALMSGDSFIPFSTGRVGVPVDTVKPELVKLIDKHGPGNLSPKHVLEETRLRPAKATPVAIRSPDTELDRAFASMRKKRMEALYPATTPTAHAEPPRSPSPQPASSPAAQPTGAGSIGSLLSFANAVQSSDRVGPTRADILAGSRAPRGEQRSQVGDDQGLQLARATPTVARAVAQVVRNSDEESQPRLGVDARGQAKRAASSGSSSSRSSSSGSSDGGALEEWWTGIAERSSTHEAVQAWQRASFGEASPAPTDAQPQPDEGSVDGSLRALERTFDAVTSARSIHEAALEQFVRMVVTNPAGDGPEEPYTWSSGREPVVALQGEVSADSADSGNESPTRPKDDNWTLRPAKPIANTAMGQPIKQLRPTRMDLSFLNVSQVEEQDPTTGAPPRRVAHDEHHEHVIRSVSQSIADETPVTLWSTQPPLHPFLKSEPFVDTSGPEARMNALIQELKESFQKRAVARAAS